MSGVNMNAKPIESSTCAVMITHTCVPSPNVVMIHSAADTTTAPGSTKGRGPTLSYSRPTTSEAMPIAMPPGSSMSPACNVSNPSTF